MKRVVALVVVTASMVILLPLQAMAASPGSPDIKTVTPDFMARTYARQALALELFTAVTDRGSMAKYQRDFTAFVARWGNARRTGAVVPTAGNVAFAMPGSVVLSLAQHPELSPAQYCVSGARTCYCGPSTAESILAYIKPTSIFGEVLGQGGDWGYGQYGLAGVFGDPTYGKSSKYLETTLQHGETPWITSRTDWPMSMTFNYWYSGSTTGVPYYSQDPVPYQGGRLTLSGYEADVTSDLWNQGAGGWPLAADVEEYPGQNGTPYLRGHPTNIEIQHWIPLYGYSSSGAYTDYIDPVYGSALNHTIGFNVTAGLQTGFSSQSIFTMVTFAGSVGPFGIVW